MAKNRIWVVEEVTLEDGSVGQRQTEIGVNDNDDGSWNWICPVERLDDDGQAEWNRVLELLRDVNGEDLRHVVCGVGLMDHCKNLGSENSYSG